MTRSRDTAPSGSGAFVFINHDATRLGTIKARSHRQVVNQHVQLAYQKSKNRANTTALRKPLPQTPQHFLGGRVALNDSRNADDDQSGPASKSSAKFPPLPSRSSQIVRRRTTQLDRTQNWTGEPPLSARNLLTKGNSDPFNSLALPFDATVNHLLSYGREVMVPSVYGLEMKSTTRSLGVAKAWERITNTFEDECSMCAYVAVSSTSVIRIAPSSDLTRLALKYKNRSSELLRQRLATMGDKIDHGLYTIVLSLSSTELAIGNFEAGLAHANLLTYLVRQQGGIQKLDPYVREMILHFDVQFSMLFLRRPAFNVREWAPKPFNAGWLADYTLDSILESSPYLLEFPAVDSSLASRVLISIIYDIREVLAVESYTFKHPVPGDSPIFRWMYLAKHACEARLLEFCADRLYSPIRTSDHFPETDNSQGAEHESLLPAFCIASLYWMAMAFGYAKQKIHAASTLLIHLRNVLQQCEPFFSASNQTGDLPNARIRLWILYIGCMAEQAMGISQRDGDSRDWHTKCFVLQMQWMGLSSWLECRNVLEGFLFADRMHREEVRCIFGPVWDVDGSEKRGSLPDGVSGAGKRWGSDQDENGFEKWWQRLESRFGSVAAG